MLICFIILSLLLSHFLLLSPSLPPSLFLSISPSVSLYSPLFYPSFFFSLSPPPPLSLTLSLHLSPSPFLSPPQLSLSASLPLALSLFSLSSSLLSHLPSLLLLSLHLLLPLPLSPPVSPPFSPLIFSHSPLFPSPYLPLSSSPFSRVPSPLHTHTHTHTGARACVFVYSLVCVRGNNVLMSYLYAQFICFIWQSTRRGATCKHPGLTPATFKQHPRVARTSSRLRNSETSRQLPRIVCHNSRRWAARQKQAVRATAWSKTSKENDTASNVNNVLLRLPSPLSPTVAPLSV